MLDCRKRNPTTSQHNPLIFTTQHYTFLLITFHLLWSSWESDLHHRYSVYNLTCFLSLSLQRHIYILPAVFIDRPDFRIVNASLFRWLSPMFMPTNEYYDGFGANIFDPSHKRSRDYFLRPESNTSSLIHSRIFSWTFSAFWRSHAYNFRYNVATMKVRIQHRRYRTQGM